MISHINGKLVEKTPTYVVIDCNGVGYKLNISLQTYSSIQTENCKLLTHLAVKEDSHTLYGFFTSEERDLFRQLISVSGVGPSTARMILSTYSAEEIVNYIITADVTALQNVKGISVLQITDILGNVVKNIELEESGEKTIYVGDLHKGIYFGNLVKNGEIVKIKKLIINK